MPPFLPAIFAFLFWGKTTAESEDRTRHSSWMRTYIFLILTICVGLIYVKTLEILPLTNYIDIRGENAPSPQDSANQVSIVIENVLDKDVRNPSDIVADKLLSGTDNEERAVGQLSSTKVEFFLSNDTSIVLNNYVRDKTYYKPAPSVPWNKALFSKQGYQFSEIYNIDSLCWLTSVPEYWKTKKSVRYSLGRRRKIEPQERDTNRFVQKYFCIIYQKNVPDLMPFHIDNVSDTIREKTGNPLMRTKTMFSKKSTWTSDHPRNIFGDVGYLQFSGIAHDRVGNTSVSTCEDYLSTSHFNHLGYFTAGDISQGILQLQMHSDIAVKELRVNFTTPTEFVQLPFTPDEISPYGFSISDSLAISQLLDQDQRLYVKFPALANKQLIRSLILTTLLTALASLFLSNLYFCLRRWIRIKLGKEEKEPEARGRVRTARFCHNTLITAIFAVLLYLVWRVFSGDYIYPSTSFSVWGWVIFLGAIVLFFAIEYLLFRYAKSELQPSDEPTTPSSLD